ncbi:MAG: hypothetical protein KatS3mg131_2743 [Candidatus Tectimicrobiota bacterium]|nr:MAG: hypothetical protein KatS3mg131_2743 [Candidatus Tectomicrobia bacterium]
MGTYIVKRLLLSLPLLVLVSLLAFSIIRIVPGDVVMLMLAEVGNLRPEQLAQLRAELGLDQPFLAQFLRWLQGVVQGDLGTSIWTGRTVGGELLRTLPVTAELAFFSLVIALLVAIPIGILSAVRRNTLLDYAGRFVAIVGLSVPEFALATIALLLLSLYVGWIPSLVYVPLWEDPLRNLGTMALPSLILGFSLAAVIMRMTRSAMLEVLREDYVRTARAQGLTGAGGGAAACLEKRLYPHHYPDWHPGSPPHRQHGGNRDHFCPARPRAPHHRRLAQPRLHAAARLHSLHCLGRRAAQSCRGPLLCLVRPAHPLPLRQDDAMTSPATTTATPPLSQRSRRHWGAQVLRLLRRHPAGALSLAITVAIVLVAVFADVLAPYDPTRIAAGPPLGPTELAPSLWD